MAKNHAIVIGINQYRFLQPLKYAKRDAEAMQDFLLKQAEFERVLFFSDDSAPVGGKSTEPFRANLLRVIRQLFKHPFMGAGDNFWFFFSGHGIPYANNDYLMPIDGDPEDIEHTGIATRDIADHLRCCGADNVVMILDACRSEGKKSGLGIGQQTENEAKRTGIISIFSCSPSEYSYEIDTLQQGVFTTALLEGLGVRGRCATVERLNQYLKHRIPELLQERSLQQTPYLIAEPLDRSHLILMPQYASLAEIAVLKNDAYQAEVNGNINLSEQLWIRVLAAASGHEMEAIQAIQRLGVLKSKERQTQKLNADQSDFYDSIRKKSYQESRAQKDEGERANPSTKYQQKIEPIRGDDLRYDLELSLQEAAFGGEKQFRISHLEACNSCKESIFKKKNFWGDCTSCAGRTLVQVSKKLKISIPPGVDTGTRLRVSNEGNAGENWGPIGDLYVYIFVKKDRKLTRNKYDILSTIEVSESQAKAGCQMEILTINGLGYVTIPSGTKNGATLRLKNRGVPWLGNPSVRGNHLVTIKFK